jgi:hypothetical protein
VQWVGGLVTSLMQSLLAVMLGFLFPSVLTWHCTFIMLSNFKLLALVSHRRD